MYLCYIDESGTSDIPGNTSHFVLAGISIPIWCWKEYDNQINKIKKDFSLEGEEIHVAWMLRKYIEQDKIPDFDKLDYKQRYYEVNRIRKAEIFKLQRSKNRKLYHRTKKMILLTWAC